jgi:hypothetical protein
MKRTGSTAIGGINDSTATKGANPDRISGMAPSAYPQYQPDRRADPDALREPSQTRPRVLPQQDLAGALARLAGQADEGLGERAEGGQQLVVRVLRQPRIRGKQIDERQDHEGQERECRGRDRAGALVDESFHRWSWIAA